MLFRCFCQFTVKLQIKRVVIETTGVCDVTTMLHDVTHYDVIIYSACVLFTLILLLR